MPDDAAEKPLTDATVKLLERVETRLRTSQITSSAWRLEVQSPEGPGSITLVDLSPSECCYRGDGVFLGWSQQDLASAYQTLRPASDESTPDLPQLG